MTPRTPTAHRRDAPAPPLTPPGSLFNSGPRAADAACAKTVEGAGGATRPAPPAVTASRTPLGAPPLGAPHREAWRQLREHGPYTLQHPAAGWTCWLPEDPARPALGIAGAVMDTLAAAGHAAIDAAGRATAIRPASPPGKAMP